MTATKSTKAATTMTAKDISEHREDIVHREATATKWIATTPIQSFESELIVLLSFLRIT